MRKILHGTVNQIVVTEDQLRRLARPSRIGLIGIFLSPILGIAAAEILKLVFPI